MASVNDILALSESLEAGWAGVAPATEDQLCSTQSPALWAQCD
jgi:hypothetical protein